MTWIIVGVIAFIVIDLVGSIVLFNAAYKAGVRDGVRLEVERSLREGGKGGT